MICDERYKILPDEVKRYALEYYGKLLAPVHPEVLDRIVANGSRAIALEPQPLDPGLKKLRMAYPDASGEERLLRAMFAGSQVDGMLAAGPMRTSYAPPQMPFGKVLEEVSTTLRLAIISSTSRKLRERRKYSRTQWLIISPGK